MKHIIGHVRHYWITILLLFICGYFLLSAIQGGAGLFRFYQLSVQVDAAQELHANLQTERIHLENLVTRLSDDYLDLDLLDEQARKRLGLIRQDEIIVN